MKALASIVGSFRILKRRARETANPGLGIWADAGEQNLAALAAKTTSAAHATECDALDLHRETTEILADGIVDAVEQARLATHPRRLKRIADRSHDIAEDFAL